MLALVFTLLGAEPKAHLDKGLELLHSQQTGAHAELVQAFTLDPELDAPPEPAVEAARAEAIATLKARLADAAAKATRAFTTPLPQSAALEPAKRAEAAPPPEAQPQPPPSLDKKPDRERPLVAGGRLSLGGYGFYVLGESRGGPAVEVAFGANLGPVRLGGAAAFLVGSALGFTLAARLSTTSQNRVAYLGAVDVGVFYGGTNAIFAPFVTAHAVGLRLKVGPVAFELHLASLAMYWLGGSTFRFVPQSGIAVLL